MNMHSVNSSNILAIGYDDNSRILRIQFKSNYSVYDYYDVSKEVFLDFIQAESKGRYHINHIRGEYDYQKIFN